MKLKLETKSLVIGISLGIVISKLISSIDSNLLNGISGIAILGLFIWFYLTWYRPYRKSKRESKNR